MTDTTVLKSSLQPEEKDSTIRVALLVEYCGLFFHGSQFQPDKVTVQRAIQEGLKQLNLETSAVSFAGRTDAGVNAQGQVAHFDVEQTSLANIADLGKALNAVLPDSVSIRGVHLDTGRQFNSRREAEAKWYRYVIYNAPMRSVWANRGASIHVPKALGAERMAEAARLILGSHDFKSFKDTDTHVTDDICNIFHAKVARDGDFIIFDVAADRFLYKMVRNLIGQLMAIGNVENPLPPETILQVLAERNRSKAAATARPEGLTLMAVQYKSPFNFFEKDVYVQQFKNILKPMESLQNENLFRKAS